MTKNYVHYTTAPEVSRSDHISCEICRLESELNQNMSDFDLFRKAYLIQVLRLRKKYRQVFDVLLKSIKQNKQQLENLTDSEVVLSDE